ncbi:MAG TPA: BamA/TamA family outer membrane protein [Polyangiales bacterium]|nr:BamA/TamA family outer membrane protein [Polyangiales bacterium]
MSFSRTWAVVCVLACWSCAGVEKGRYGVDSLEIEGAKKMAAPSLRMCLLTRERDEFGLTLGLRSPRCDAPPFDSSGPRLTLWHWPWTDWPTFNQSVLDKDVERILRWYRSRGFYQARVVEVKVEPPEAGNPGSRALRSCDPDRQTCTVEIKVVIEEGEPLSITHVEVEGEEGLPAALREQLEKALSLEEGERFDEYDYDHGKDQLLDVLKNAAHAGATVTGNVEIQTATHAARVTYRVEAGPEYTIGKLTVSGHGPLSAEAIIAAARVEPNTPYTPEVRADIQREVQALGGFAAVTVEPTLHPERGIADLELQIQRADRNALRLGVGIQSGSIQRGDDATLTSVPQWDIHLLARYTYSNVFDTLGTFTLDERPRLIYNAAFPSVNDPGFGNIVSASINQPGLVEARTDTGLSTSWDYGPDPYLGFTRSDITTRLGLRRRFFSRKLELSAALEQDFYIVPQENNEIVGGEPGEELPTTYYLSFLAQRIVVDLRDSPARATRGAYFGLMLSEALRWKLSDWTLFLVQPEARFYVPLPLDIVFAARLALGWIIITNASSALDPTSQQLGPSVYRLRGGGANSVRGFPAGELGVGIDGGTRRWEAMFEARVPIGASFELAALLDFGDVSIDEFRFDYLNTSTGLGLRYHSPIGALRLDIAFRIMPLQRLDGTQPEVTEEQRTIFNAPGAVHFTIGESF